VSPASSTGSIVGGIVGEAEDVTVSKCANNAHVICDFKNSGVNYAGGIAGIGCGISNCYNTGNIIFSETPSNAVVAVGGIVGGLFESTCQNVYSTGLLSTPTSAGAHCGIIAGGGSSDAIFKNLYWYDDYDIPVCGDGTVPEGSCSFRQGTTATTWVLDEAQYGTTDLLDALNAGSYGECVWFEDLHNTNYGFPIIDIYEDYPLVGNEWYYEITTPSGDISFQHLSHVSDTTLNHKKVKVIVKTNTLYDKDNVIQTREYIYDENGKVYWWNKTLEEFTVLYNFAAMPGDEWQIEVGTSIITMHVDAIGAVNYNGSMFKSLTVSDENDVFSGTIVCGIGHLTSFFPELPEDKGDYEVNSLRCYWNNDDLLYKEGDVDCDYIYHNYHFGVDENEAPAFTIYPNPANNVVYINDSSVEMQFITSQIELMDIHGQRMEIRVKDNQIDVSNLQNGIYFIKIGNDIVKMIINK